MTKPKSSPRRFGLLMAGLFPLFFGVLPFLFSRKLHVWPFVVGAIFLFTALTLAVLLGPVEKVWLKFGVVMGWINTRIVLSLVYFVVFVPAALIRRMKGYDPLERTFDPKLSSYRSIRSVEFKEIMMERPF